MKIGQPNVKLLFESEDIMHLDIRDTRILTWIMYEISVKGNDQRSKTGPEIGHHVNRGNQNREFTSRPMVRVLVKA